MNNDEDVSLLANCYENSLALATRNNLRTIAFPSISTGAFGYPKHEAAVISSKTIENFLSENNRIEQVRLIFFSKSDAEKFIKHQVFGFGLKVDS